ncbi:MAG: hypothetical protein ACT4OO_08415 [Nitrospiraceae bacterium]
MGRLNTDPLITLSDGSQLLISTQYSQEGSFACLLYVANLGAEDRLDLRLISNPPGASTCLEAQEIAYSYARRLYPGVAGGMKKPPYLIWRGPTPPT